MLEVPVTARSPQELAAVLPAHRIAELVDGSASRMRSLLHGHAVVNVNSTAVGGGVAEMLRALLPYARGVGIDARWFVMDDDPDLFVITKRLHNHLHGFAGDGGPLGPAEAERFAEAAAANASQLAGVVAPGDVLTIHDPQPAGLLPICRTWDVPVIWRCHIGTQHPNGYSEAAWAFLRPFIEGNVDAFVFTRASYAPSWIPPDRLHVISPSIDPLSPKNQDMDVGTALDVLRHVGIVDGGTPVSVSFQHPDKSPGRVMHFADVSRTGPPPGVDTPLVVQVSRWDTLKDMAGVMHGFVEHVLDGTDAHLVLAGPVVTGIADDPESAAVLEDVRTQWRALPHTARSRVQLVCLPMTDPDENAAIVNALQRHAAVVVQKSLEEGFGLTVTEAMFKGAAVVASRVGGITDQVVDGVNGRLVDDPRDLAAFGAAVSSLLTDEAQRDELGERARASVFAGFLPDTSLIRWGEVVAAAVKTHADGG